ncbi:DUF1998 domain-containing protein [Demequina sp.]|uniref:DUF1998 domain-containing protein n=1 Tax=Demequina sp. TaxID=2050685 RepID=UPI0025C562DE|nr:DUF1998 domain-containing protein [Demequina sp.]
MTTRVLRLSASQLISPFGPGAVVDVLGESFVTLTGENWPKRSLLEEVVCERLSSRIGVQKLYRPPMRDDAADPHALGIQVARFPAWLFCQTCRQMVRWGPKEENGVAPACTSDGGRLVPMRFVVACRDRSHATDVPWREWVHRAPGVSTECKEGPRLRFRQAANGSPGLSGLEVICDACDAARTLGDLRADVLVRDGLRCHGVQPWEGTWKECDSPLEVLQRGATSFHYGETTSAIDIPSMTRTEMTVEERVSAHPLFLGLKESLHLPHARALAEIIAAALDITADVVEAIASEAAVGGIRATPGVRAGLLAEEFAAFEAANRDEADEVNFKTRKGGFELHSVDPVERALANLFESIVLVDRLREVRASVSFSRYRPDADPVPSVSAIPNEASWLPAIEGFGEGIFLRVSERAVNEWLLDPGVQARAGLLEMKAIQSRFAARLHNFSAQFVALHSLAHALLRELAFTSGYTAASLRERVYCGEGGNYGVFIYTTSSDEEGTLGGLVREGEHDRIGTAIARAIAQLNWCSNDPVCAESDPHNLDGLNLAACHSCLLASETSCEGSNVLLDRVLLVGDEHTRGLLVPVLDAITG